MKELQDAFDQLRSRRIDLGKYKDPSRYSEADLDVVFDFYDVEAFIAGLADSLLGGYPVTSENMRIAQRPLLVGSSWTCVDGRRMSLDHLPEALEYARILERVRRAVVGQASSDSH